MSENLSEHDKLDELLDLTRENNRILRGMHRRMLWSQIFTFFYWMVILGALGWSYYYLEPYLDKYWSMYQEVSKVLSSFEQSDLGSLLDKTR